MSELDTIILTKIEKVESDLGDIKVAVAENTNDLKHHIKRTDELQSIVEKFSEVITPLHTDYVSKKAVEEFKKKQREDLIYRLKLPGYIVAAAMAIGTAIAWIMRK